MGSPGGSEDKESTCNARDLSSIPGLARSPGGGHGNPLQYSCLKNPMDRGAQGAGYSPWGRKETRLSHTHTHTHTHVPASSQTLSSHVPVAAELFHSISIVSPASCIFTTAGFALGIITSYPDDSLRVRPGSKPKSPFSFPWPFQ